MHSHTCTNTVGHTVAALSQWALVSGQALSLQLAQTSSDSGRLVDQEPEWTAVSKFTKSCGKKAQLVLKAFHSIMNQSLNIMFYFKKKKEKKKKKRERDNLHVSKADFNESLLSSPPLQLCGEIPLAVRRSDRLFWVSASEFIYNQSGRSPLGIWWFLTPGQADVQRTWIKHTAHLTTDRRLSECLMKYEAWFQFNKEKKKKNFVR